MDGVLIIGAAWLLVAILIALLVAKMIRRSGDSGEEGPDATGREGRRP